MRLLLLAILILAMQPATNKILPPPVSKKLEGLPKQILLSPIYKQRHFCSEHTAVSWDLGDSLATDCMIVSDFGQGYHKFYRTDGKRNEDWYGWHANVLAPIDGKVVGTYVNNVENTPGMFGKGASVRYPANERSKSNRHSGPCYRHNG